MIVKEVVDEYLLTLPEVKQYLEEILNDRKKNEEEEQCYEFRKAMNHATTFSKLKSFESRELVNKLIDNKISISIAIKIADLLPITNDEVRAIFSKEKYTLKDDTIKLILDYIKNYI